jgi:signal peptidase II
MSTGHGASERSWRPWSLFGLIALVVVVADQLTKAWIETSFELASSSAPPGSANAPTPVLGDLVRIARTWNDGGVFGLFGDSAMVLGVASVLVIGIIVWVEATSGVRSPLLTIALGLLLGGAIGNLIDRLRFGHVIDWVDTGLGSLRFYTFNVADSAISIAVVLLLAMSLLGPRLGRLVGASPASTSGDRPVTDGGQP